MGSTVHGLSNPGTDDRDEMGVCVEPREYVLGLRPFEHFVHRTGRISLPVPEPHRARLMAVRRGEPTLDEAVEELDAATATLARLVDATGLPKAADAVRIDRFLVSAYERAWGSA